MKKIRIQTAKYAAIPWGFLLAVLMLVGALMLSACASPPVEQSQPEPEPAAVDPAPPSAPDIGADPQLGDVPIYPGAQLVYEETLPTMKHYHYAVMASLPEVMDFYHAQLDIEHPGSYAGTSMIQMGIPEFERQAQELEGVEDQDSVQQMMKALDGQFMSVGVADANSHTSGWLKDVPAGTFPQGATIISIGFFVSPF